MKRKTKIILTILLLLIATVLAVIGYAVKVNIDVALTSEKLIQLDYVINKFETHTVEETIKVFSGKYPGWAQNNWVFDRWNRPLKIDMVTSGSSVLSYSIRSSGRDRVDNTNDDLNLTRKMGEQNEAWIGKNDAHFHRSESRQRSSK